MADDDMINLAVKLGKNETKIDSHLDECARRYREQREQMERMFTFIKESHAETTKKIDDTTDDTNQKISDAINVINGMQTVLAEARGAGKLGKLIGHIVTGLLAAGTAIVSMKTLK